MDSLKIGKHIAECRKEKGMTQSQLAEKLGVTNKTVSRWENGNYMPDLSLLAPLSKVLEITLEELLSGERSESVSEKAEKAEETLTKTIQYSGEKIKSARRKLILASIVALVAVIAAVALIIHYNGDKLLKAEDGAEWQKVDYALIKNNTIMTNCYSYLEDDHQAGSSSIVWVNVEHQQPLMTGFVVQVIAVDGDKCEICYPWSDTPALYGMISTKDLLMESIGFVDYLKAKQSSIKSGTSANVYKTCDLDSEVIGTMTGPVQIEAMDDGWYWAQELVGGGNTSGYIRQADLIRFKSEKILVSTGRKKHMGKAFAAPESPIISVNDTNDSTYTKKDLFDAIDIVSTEFVKNQVYSGCKLLSLQYSGAWSDERKNSWEITSGKDECIGVDVSFTTDGTVKNNSWLIPHCLYEDYTFVLGRTPGGQWEVIDYEW